LRELALAAPVLAALERHAIEPTEVVELSREKWPVLAGADPRVEACVRGREVAAARYTYRDRPPLRAGGAPAVAVLATHRHDPEVLADACACAAEWVVLASTDTAPALSAGWSIVDELPGTHPVCWRLTARASRGRLRRALGHSTTEHREHWLRMLQAACFGDEPAFRIYVLRRGQPLRATPERWSDASSEPRAPRWQPPLGGPGVRLGGVATKALRLVRAEWALRRSPRRGASSLR
jgi:hypothetical protein